MVSFRGAISGFRVHPQSNVRRHADSEAGAELPHWTRAALGEWKSKMGFTTPNFVSPRLSGESKAQGKNHVFPRRLRFGGSKQRLRHKHIGLAPQWVVSTMSYLKQNKPADKTH